MGFVDEADFFANIGCDFDAVACEDFDINAEGFGMVDGSFGGGAERIDHIGKAEECQVFLIGYDIEVGLIVYFSIG